MSNRGRLGACLALGALLAWQIYAFQSVRHDDPFITYRYGQNLASGYGLTFNPAERFLGSTSPGHTLLSATAYALVGQESAPALMSALGCLGWTAQSVAAYFLLLEALGATGALVVAFALQLGAATAYLWVPFETNLVAALVLGALAAAKRKRLHACAVLTGLAVLMRPDALILAGLLGVLALRTLRTRALSLIALSSAFFLPWIVFAFVYYGSPLPHSAVEKFRRTTMASYFQHELQLFANTLLALWPPSVSLWLVPVVIAWGAFAVSALWMTRRDPFVAVAALYALLHWCAYLVLRPFTGHDWHLYPANLVAVMLVFAGLAYAAQHAKLASLRALAGISLLALMLAGAARTGQAAQSYPSSYWTGERDAAYRRVAVYLQEHARPGDHFASVEVGTIAYYTGMPAYDLGGLITDLRRTNMVDRPVRWLVLDKKYLSVRPRWAPVLTAREGDFEVQVYALPVRPAR